MNCQFTISLSFTHTLALDQIFAFCRNVFIFYKTEIKFCFDNTVVQLIVNFSIFLLYLPFLLYQNASHKSFLYGFIATNLKGY